MRFRPLPPLALTAALAGALLVPGGTASAGEVTSAAARPVVAAGVTPASGAPSAVPSPPVLAAEPVAPRVRSYAVPRTTGRGTTTLDDDAARPPAAVAALSSPVPAPGVAVTGVTWAGPAPEGLAVAVRTRTGSSWSPWRELPYDVDHGPDSGTPESAGSRSGTDAFVAGNVDDVQVRASSADGTAPRDLTLTVVDPGSSQTTDPATTGPQALAPDSGRTTSSSLAPTDPVNSPDATTMPTIYSRAAWGADERLRDCCVEYGEVHAGFVHHTVNANDYTADEVPAILRGIYAYHTQSRGWRDIGYNFLIDKFGRIWEGRYGGVERPVIGAHTLGYNENSFAASAIGNFETVSPPSAMIDAYARLYAWKLSLHGVRPRSRPVVAGTTFNAISGHRDAASTACPGRYLYAQIPTIIDKAAGYQRSFAGRDLQRSFQGDAVPDLLLLGSDGTVSAARGTGPPGFDALRSSGLVPGDVNRVVATADVTGDGRNDLLVRNSSTGVTTTYPGTGTGSFGAAVRASSRWADTDLFAARDVTGDGRVDIVARRAGSPVLWRYPGRGDGTFGAGAVAAPDAASYDLLAPAGDFDRDGDQDLVVRTPAGALQLLLGDGAGTFPTRRALSGDWSGRNVVSGGADATGDGWPDLIARDASTSLVRIFPNQKGTALAPGIGGRTLKAAYLGLSRDLSGDNRADLVGLSRGEVAIWPGRRANWLATPRSTRTSWPGTDTSMVVGDWDRDGYVDAMARRSSTGTLELYRGSADGTFSGPAASWSGWSGRTLLTPVGDFDGDGYADIAARASSGSIYLYPGRGTAGFRAPVLMRSSLPTGATMVAAGLWNGDGAPDVLVTTSEGRLLLYPGNGPGGLDDPVEVATGVGSYDTLVGVGDLTGDRQPDLVGRTAAGSAWLLPGLRPTAADAGGGIAARQYLASFWSGYRLG